MANYEATRYNFQGTSLTGIQGVLTGTVIPWSASSPPSGFLECNGQSLSTSTYADLFAVIGYTYGGSGASFNVPDLQDRVSVAASVTNSKSLAQSGGANTVTPTGNVGGCAASTTLSSSQIPSHLHSAGVPSGTFGQGAMGCFMSVAGPSSGQTGNTGGGQSHTHSLSANFVGSANSVLQPYLVLIYIIKTWQLHINFDRLNLCI